MLYLTPYKRKIVRGVKCPLLTGETAKLMNQWDFFLRKARRSGAEVKWNAYRWLWNQLSNKIRMKNIAIIGMKFRKILIVPKPFGKQLRKTEVHGTYLEMEIAVKQGSQIISKITDLISQLEGLKLDFGASAWEVQQWKKDTRNEFFPFVQERDKISKLLSTKQRQRWGNRETELGDQTRAQGARPTRTTTTRKGILTQEVQSRVVSCRANGHNSCSS